MNHTIKYLTITIIYDNSSNPIEQFIKYIGLYDEYYIKSTDTVIIETDTETFELDLTSTYTQDNDQNIIFDIDFNKNIVNSIYKNTPDKNLNLKYNEPYFNGVQFTDTHIKKLFCGYKSQYKLDCSYYCCTYTNIKSDTLGLGLGLGLGFGLTKLKYNGKNTARYVLAYDYTLLNIDELKIIIKQLLLKNDY